MPESRRLELNGYLTKPTTRLARYPLLLGQVIKYTKDGEPDEEALADVIKQVKQFLSKVNEETGKSENRFQMANLSDLLIFKPGEEVDLRLKEEGRELVFKGPLKRRGGSGQGETAELQAYLFDHAFVVVKPKIVHKIDILKVNRRPIPLELLVCTVYEDITLPSAGGGGPGKPSGKLKTLTTRMSTGTRLTSVLAAGVGPKQDTKIGFPLRFTYLGRKGYSMTLWASTYAGRKKWFEHVDEAQGKLRKRSNIFETMTLGPVSAFTPPLPAQPAPGSGHPPKPVPTEQEREVHPTCCVPFDFGRRVIYGSNNGVFLSELRKDARAPTKVLPLRDVTQIEVLEEYQILLVLADKTLWTFTLDALDPTRPKESLRLGRRIQGTVHFFCVGTVNDKMLVCAVKSSTVSSTIRLFEPLDAKQRARGSRRRPVSLQWTGGQTKGQDALRIFKDFYVSTESSSAVFLKNRLCLSCAKGFEIVDIDTLDTQGILDATDHKLDFLARKELSAHPLAMYLVHGEFLLCYAEFAFYVNRFGRRSRPDWAVVWEGQPESFALSYPFLLAFDSNFVEVRHIKTGALHQILTGSRLRCLFADPMPYVPSKKDLQVQQQHLREREREAAAPLPAMHAGHASRPSDASIRSVSTVVGASGAAAAPPSHPMTPARSSVLVPAGSAPIMHLQQASMPYRTTYGAQPPPSGTPGAPGPLGRPMQVSMVPYAFGQAHTVPIKPASVHSPMWESAFASRNNILLQGDNSIYALRPAGGGMGLLEPLTLAHHSGPPPPIRPTPPSPAGRRSPSLRSVPPGVIPAMTAVQSIPPAMTLGMPSGAQPGVSQGVPQGVPQSVPPSMVPGGPRLFPPMSGQQVPAMHPVSPGMGQRPVYPYGRPGFPPAAYPLARYPGAQGSHSPAAGSGRAMGPLPPGATGLIPGTTAMAPTRPPSAPASVLPPPGTAMYHRPESVPPSLTPAAPAARYSVIGAPPGVSSLQHK